MRKSTDKIRNTFTTTALQLNCRAVVVMEQKGLNRSLLGDFSDFVIVAVLILVVMEYTQ